MDANEKENSIFEQIEGLEHVDPEALEDFKRAMTEEVIPEIVRVVEERRKRAAETRQRKIKAVTERLSNLATFEIAHTRLG